MDTRVFRALHDLAVAVSGVLEPLEMARLVAAHARDLLDVDAVAVYRLETASNMLRPIYSSDASDSSPEQPLEPGSGTAGRAFLTGTAVAIADLPEWPHTSPWVAANGMHSSLAVPLTVNDRRTGAVAIRSRARREWTAAEAETLTLLAAQIAPALEAARRHEAERAARQQAEAAIKLRDEVLAGVSHDLSGPLARVRLYAELMQAEISNLLPGSSAPQTANQLTDWSERIVAATEAMKSLMKELLDVARLQMGQALALDLRPTDLAGLVRRLVSEHQAAGRLVTLHSTTDELIGYWDEPRLSRVINNLLDNAFNYSPPSAPVEVTVSTLAAAPEADLADENHRDAVLAVLDVRDHGQGISADDLPRVFERFFRGSNVLNASSGNGLGLAVARQIVEQHGGTICIDSNLGSGTLVSLRLPCSGPAEPPTQ
jgi:signal transduction histidine kinase